MLFTHINILCPNGSILPNAYVKVEGSFITYLSSEAPFDAKEQIQYNGKGKCMLPGLINSHCHVPMTLLRSAGAGLPLDAWLNTCIFPLEGRMTAKDSYTGSLLGIAEMLRSGITSFTDMYIFGHQRCKAVIESGIKANICMGVNCFDDSPFDNLPFVKETKELIAEYHNAENGRLKIDAGIHGEYTSNPRVVKAMGALAQKYHLNTHIHLGESKTETEGCKLRHQKTPTAYFRDLGFFENKTTAAHCIHVTEADLDILAENHVTVAHCPSSNLKLGSGIADVIAMEQKGISVAIGTDGVASNDNLYFFEEMKLSSLLQKGIHQDPTLLPASHIFQMATQNAALSQSRIDTAAIQVGYRADLAIIDLHAIHLTATADLANTILYSAQASDVCLTMVDGKILYQDGNFLSLDIEKAMADAHAIAKRLKN